jgi:chitodextrinase
VATNSVNLTGLTGSTSYSFEVRARDGAGNLSTVRAATLNTADGTPPSQPGAVSISLVTATTARANWGPSTDNVAVTAYDYRLNGGSWVALTNVTQVDMSGLTQLTSYTFEVRARDNAGNTSAVRAASPFTTTDGSAPSQPGPVSIGSITGTSATATWTASTDNVGVAGYDYRLNAGSWIDAGNVVTLNLTGLSQATSYTFEVRARDGAGNLSVVRTAAAFSTLDVSAPSQPGSVVVSLVTATTARVTWNASTDNVGIAGYDYRLNGGAWINAGNVTLVNLTGLSQVTSYTVEVRARDGAGNVSSAGGASPFTTLDGTAPSQPGAASVGSIGGTTATASWGAASDNVAVTGYDYRLNSGSWISLGVVTSVNLSGLSEFTTYTFEVRARDAAGNVSAVTTAPNFQTLDVTAPSAPSSLTFNSVGAFSAGASWGPSTDNVIIATYQYRLTTQAQWTDTGLLRSAFLGGLAPQTTYTVEVRARDNAGNVGPVVSNSFTTTIAPPAAPTNLAYNQVADCAWTASWSGVSAATSYVVRDTNGSEQTTTSTSISINCPIGNPQGNKPLWVKACNGGGCSGEAQFGGTGGDQLAPSTPTNLSATNVQPTTATISWNPSSDNVAVAGYQWALNSGGWNGVSVTSVGLTGLIDNFTHTVYVRAYDAAGNYSASAQVSFTTPTAPDTTAPSAVPNLRVGSNTSSSARLDWDAASDNLAVAGYNYRLTTTPTWTVAGTALSATIGTVGSTSYTFEVRARDSAGNLGSVNSISFTTPPGIPNPPADAWSSQGGSCWWNVWWSPPSSGSTPTYYRIRESGTGIEKDWTQPQPGTVNFMFCEDPNSNKPSWVKACNAQGCSTSRSVRMQ